MKYGTKLKFRKVWWALVGYPKQRRPLNYFWKDQDGAWFVALLIGLAINIVAYLIMPKPKTPKPEAAKDMDDPTADAGRPVPVIVGTVTVKGLNVLDFRDKNMREREIDA